MALIKLQNTMIEEVEIPESLKIEIEEKEKNKCTKK